MERTLDQVISQRLRTQRLTSAPLEDPADVVRLLLCVQAQDPQLARFSVGMRTLACTDLGVRGAMDDSRIVRTHILRPTWHFVAAEDLRWLLALTSPKVESGLAARHRQLGLDSAVVEATLDAFHDLLAGRRYRTRRALAAELAAAGLPRRNDQLGHLLLIAELRGLVCSGLFENNSHTYGLVDELVVASTPRDREDAIRELAARFFAGHGPAAIDDLTRWTRVTKAEIRRAVGDLGDRLRTVTVEGVQLWFDPAVDVAGRPSRRAFLLPVFDEAYLTYKRLNFPRADGHPRGAAPHSFAEAGGGVVVLDRRDVGWWKRRNSGPVMEVTLALSHRLQRGDRELVAAEASRLATFSDRGLEVRIA